MKIIIQHTDSDGKTKFIEKVATCRPEGMLSMTDDVFDDAMYEQQFEVDNMKDGMEKMEASLRFANSCIDCGVYYKALQYYYYVLKKSVADGKIIKEYEYLAGMAYQGFVCCNSCSDECTYEVSSELLEGYRDLFK